MGYEHIKGHVNDYYRDKVLPKWDMIAAWARSGLSNKQIAKNLGIGQTTIERYIDQYEEFADWMREAREDAEMIVENALFKRATGYDYYEVTKERKMDEDGEWRMVTTKKVKKHVMPDVGAAQYWLEHRAPRKWQKNVTPPPNTDQIQAQIAGIAALLASPVKERKIGSENE